MTHDFDPPTATPPDAPATHLRSCLIRDVRLVPVGDRGRRGSARASGTETEPSEGLVDVRIRDGVVEAVAPGLDADGLEVHDGGGRWAMPGLWDAHAHLGQWVQMSMRLDTSAARSPEEACSMVRAGLRHLAPGETLQGWGHRSATWSREPSVAELDEVSGAHPVVLISGDGHHGWANTRAMDLLGVAHRPGVIEEAEWFGVFPQLMELPGVTGAMEARYSDVVARINATGITGVVDMEFSDSFRAWPRRFAGAHGSPVDTVRVRTATYAEGLEAVLGAGLRSGARLPGGGGLLEMGPLKIISDGSLNTRTAYCCEPFADGADFAEPCGVQNVPPAELLALLSRAHGAGLEVAVHAIGDRAVGEAVDAFEATGARGSVEHVQLIRWGDVPRMAALGIRASVQPAHLLDDRDVSVQCWPDRLDRTFALRTMREAGVALRFGSDAPVSPLDPWLEIAAAVHRSADARDPLHPEQALTAAEALADSTDGQGTLAPGARGDVLLLDRDPLAIPITSREASAALRETRVAATVVAGRLVHG